MMEKLLAVIMGIIAIFSFGAIMGNIRSENKKLNQDAKSTRTARKVEDENRNLSRDELIDKL